jgi:choline dehydrogenase-like flavoprotein
MPTYDFDVVIVGAGIAGALTAHKLAEANLRVLIIEAGDPLPRVQEWIDQFYSGSWPFGGPSPTAPQPGDPTPEWRDPSKNYFEQDGPLPFGSTYEIRAGGTTLHWIGTAMRFLPNDFKMKSLYDIPGSRDWPISYEELEPWYTAAEYEIGVAGDDANIGANEGERSKRFPMPMVPQSYLDLRVASALNGKLVNGVLVSVSPTPQARNTVAYDRRPPCMGNTSCFPICPIRAKYDATTTLSKATAAGATLWTNCVVGSVTVDKDTSLITAVNYVRVANNSTETLKGAVTARVFILAANAIETAKILLMSQWRVQSDGIRVTAANSSDQVGRNLMDHVCQVSWGTTKDPVFPYRGPISTSGIESFRDGPKRKVRAAYRVEIGNEGWNWPTNAPISTVVALVRTNLFGSRLRNALRTTCTRHIRMAFEPESLPLADSRVQLSQYVNELTGIPRPRISYRVSDYTLEGYADTVQTANEMFAIMNIRNETIVSKNEPGYFEYKGVPYQYRGAGHVIGTYRMGDTQADSVVNKDQRCWDHSNMYLLGSGVFPTTGTANPTLTLAALSLRTADIIKQELRS